MDRPLFLLPLFALALTVAAADPAPATAKSSARAPLGTPAGAADLHLAPDFKIEVLHHTTADEGSWVSLCAGPNGELYTSDQYGYIYRITPPPPEQPDATEIERININAGMAHGLLYAFDSLYFMGFPVEEKEAHDKRNDRRSLWRAKSKGNGEFEEPVRIATFEFSGEHGPHALVLSPDGRKIYLCCGNHTPTPDFPKSIAPNKSWQEDSLLPRMFDPRGHARGIMAPGGFMARCNPDGSELELYSFGYRNQYDFAFDQNGEMFTYDSDMEWDLGLPWYRPTRILHATPGSDFGWRSGSSNPPAWFFDSLPPVENIGPGSPTGLTFGTGAKFPAKYQHALFAMDWSFGTLYAVHLRPEGATYAAEKEVFLSGTPLPLADMVVLPQDGALYVAAGGRKNESALYRITYTGSESTAPAPKPQLTELQLLRRQLEEHSAAGDAQALALAWPQLDHPDRFIRYAARMALENQPVAQWQETALGESRPRALRQAVLALARMSTDKTLQPRLIDCLLSQGWASLPAPDRLEWVRAAQIVFCRTGDPQEGVASRLLGNIDNSFPTADDHVDRELATLLIFLKSPTIVGKAVEQMYTAQDPAEVAFGDEQLNRGGGYGRVIAEMQKLPAHKQQIHYAFELRCATAGWTGPLRDKYFAWFGPARLWKGGNSFPLYLTNARDEALEKIESASEKQRLLSLATYTGAEPKLLPRPEGPGQDYTLEDFKGVTLDALRQRNLAHGKVMFEAALCASCHRFGADGGAGGPDLTGAGARYTPADLLTAILDPDKEISDQYAFTEFTMKDGSTVLGRVSREDERELQLITTFLAPEALTPIQKNKIKHQALSKTSPMLPGLLNALNKDEALDLLAFLMLGAQ